MNDVVNKAVECLRQGQVILFPTDTVWSMGCDAANSQAVKRLFEIKNHAPENDMLILVSDTKMIGRYFRELPDVLFDLEENSNRPMTYVLEGPLNVDKTLVSNENTLGVRIPAQGFCNQLIRKFGKAIVSVPASASSDHFKAGFAGINPAIVNAVDFCVEPSLEKGAAGQPASIIKIKPNGEFSFIRK